MDGKPSLGKAQKIGTCSTQQPDFQVSINPHCKSIWKKGNPGTSSHRRGWSTARSHTLWLSNVLSDELPHLRPNSTLFFTWAFLLNPNPNHHIFFLCEVGTWSKWKQHRVHQVLLAHLSASEMQPHILERPFSPGALKVHRENTSWTKPHISSLKPNQLCCHTPRWFCLERSLTKSWAATA